MEFRIAQQWDGAALGHAGIEIRLQPSPAGDAVVMEMNGPFFNDPSNPGGAVGKPFPNLWDYEGKEETVACLTSTSNQISRGRRKPGGWQTLKMDLN